MPQPQGAPLDGAADVGLVARAAIRLTAWTERWIPDAFIFALPPELLDGRTRAIQVFAVNEPPGANPEVARSPAFLAGRRDTPPAGYFDGLTAQAAVGWAYDPDARERPIEVEVWVDDRLHARVPADRPRPDLVRAGQSFAPGRRGAAVTRTVAARSGPSLGTVFRECAVD